MGRVALLVSSVAFVLAACERTPSGSPSGAAARASATSATTEPPVSSSAPASSPSPLTPLPPTPAFVQAMVGAEEAIDTGDYALADRQLDAAAAAAGNDAHFLFAV